MQRLAWCRNRGLQTSRERLWHGVTLLLAQKQYVGQLAETLVMHAMFLSGS